MEFSELFTQGVRNLLPVARRKGLVPYFDCLGTAVALAEPDAAIRAGLHRIMLAMIDLLDSGFIMFCAESSQLVDGTSHIMVHAAGTGAVRTTTLDGVLQRLGLLADPADVPGQNLRPRAEGICPATGARVQFVDAGTNGIVLSLEMDTPASEPERSTDVVPDANGAIAWLVSGTQGGLDSLQHRLRRQGWQVKRFTELAKASAELSTASRRAIPKLIVVTEDSRADLDQLEQIAMRMPSVWTVLAVLAGSASIRFRGRTSVDIRVVPISPLELDQFTSHVDWRTSTPESRATVPMALYVQQSRWVLVVDDNPVNQVVARGQLEALGCDVLVAANGAAALDTCQDRAPDLVLMDVDMPVMDGLEATTHIRTFQSIGALPPFPIVAATSGAARREECLQVGMDGYLNKPMDMQALADEILRLLPSRPVMGDIW
jgi:CheY-like chemotaxis protein